MTKKELYQVELEKMKSFSPIGQSTWNLVLEVALKGEIYDYEACIDSIAKRYSVDLRDPLMKEICKNINQLARRLRYIYYSSLSLDEIELMRKEEVEEIEQIYEVYKDVKPTSNFHEKQDVKSYTLEDNRLMDAEYYTVESDRYDGRAMDNQLSYLSANSSVLGISWKDVTKMISEIKWLTPEEYINRKLRIFHYSEREITEAQLYLQDSCQVEAEKSI